MCVSMNALRSSALKLSGLENSVLVIEHNMRVIMNLAEHIYCLAHGEMLAEGNPDEIQNDQRVIDVYLGS